MSQGRNLPVQPGGVDPDGLYLLGHYHGLYSGPCGHLEMVDGVPDCGPVEGCLITHGGLENLCEVFESAPGRRLKWNGEAWKCVDGESDAPAEEAEQEPEYEADAEPDDDPQSPGAVIHQRRRRRGRR